MNDPLTKLFDWQRESAFTMADALHHHGAGLNASDMGTGKTYVISAAAALAKVKLLVVCPAGLCTKWREVAQGVFGVPTNAMSYEKLRRGDSPFGRWRRAKGVEKCNGLAENNRGEVFDWNPELRSGWLVVYDEVHRCKAFDSLQSVSLWHTRRCRIPSVSASATPAQSPLDFRSLGYVLNLFSNDPDGQNFWRWMRKHRCRKLPGLDWEFQGTAAEQTEEMARIHHSLFTEANPPKGVRLRIEDLRGHNNFPENFITASLYDCPDPAEARKQNAALDAEIKRLDAKVRMGNHTDPLVLALRAAQRLELLKVPIVELLAQDAVLAGRSVIIFCSFRATLQLLAERLHKHGVSVIHGDLSAEEKEVQRKLLQEDRHRVCVAITKAGGVGLDMHDITGRYPRKVYHLPGFSALDFVQATGRPVRAGAKSPVQQEAVLLDHDRDRRVYSNLCRRLSNIEALTDADLESEWAQHASYDWMARDADEE